MSDAQPAREAEADLDDDAVRAGRVAERLAQRSRQHAAVAALGDTALETGDLQDLFEEAVERLAMTLGVELCKVLELLPDREQLLLRAGVGWDEGLVGAGTVGAGLDSQAGYTLQSRSPVVVRELAREERFCGPPLLTDHGVVSGLSVIIGRHEQPWGVLGVHTRELREFTIDDVNFVQSVAHVLWAAIRQRQVSSALELSMDRLQLALEAGHMGIWDWDMVADDVVWSQGHYELLGYDESAEAGYAAWRQRVHPDDLARVEAAVAAAREQRTPYSTEYRVIHPDGSVHWLEARGRYQYDADGDAIRLNGVLLDIDVRKRAEAELAMTEERLRVALENAPLMMFHCDPDLRYTWLVNRHTALPGEDVVGKRDDDVFPADVASELIALKQRALESGEGQRGEFSLREDGHDAGGDDGRDEGEVVWHLSVEPVHGGDAGVVGLIGAGLDVTGARRAQRELEHAARQKDEFLALLGHELRNPLAAVTTALALLRDPPGADAFRESVEMIERQSRQLRRLVDDLLHVSRITRGDIEIRAGAVRLDEVIDGLRRALSERLAERRLVVELPEEPVFLYADPARLDQILGNLLTNAAKYSDVDSEVRLTVIADGDEVEIRLQDQGIGMDAETREQVFQPFVRATGKYGEPEAGLGVGLTLVKKLVEIHGGTVHAASPGPGRGSTFTVRLAAATREQIAAAESEAATTAEKRRGRSPRVLLRVLVVDDNVDLAEGLQQLLERAGHEVRVAHKGEDGIATAQEWRPDAVLLDIGLPDIDGHEVATRMRVHDDRLWIAALSGFKPDDDPDRDVFDRYLIKPVEIDEVLQALDTAMAGEDAGSP